MKQVLELARAIMYTSDLVSPTTDTGQDIAADSLKSSTSRSNRDRVPSQSSIVLEVLTRREMASLLRTATSVAVFAVLLTLCLTLIMRFHLFRSSSQEAPVYAMLADSTTAFVCLFVLAASFVLFGRQIQSSSLLYPTAYQVSTLAFIGVLVVTAIPLRAMAELAHVRDNTPHHVFLYADAFLKAAMIFSLQLYVWLSCRLCRQTYKTPDGRVDWSDVLSQNAYVVAMTGSVLLFKIVTTVFLSIAFSPLPLQSFSSLVIVFFSGPDNPIELPQTLAVVLTTLLEIAILTLIAKSMRTSAVYLTSVDFNKHRSDAIMYRFFATSATLVMAPLVFIAACQLGYPADQIKAFEASSGILVLSPSLGWGPLMILLAFFAGRQAYVNRPAPSRPQVRQDSSAATGTVLDSKYAAFGSTQLIYRSIDKRDGDRSLPILHPAVFSLESAVTCFNLSWLVYTYGTVGFTPGCPADYGRKDITVTKHMVDTQLDVHAIVADAMDRILVCFKGSNSQTNALTDRDCKLVPVLQAFKTPGASPSSALPARHLHGDANTWRGCKAHRGYAEAYSRVRGAVVEEVFRLYDEKDRPIFITGQ